MDNEYCLALSTREAITISSGYAELVSSDRGGKANTTVAGETDSTLCGEPNFSGDRKSSSTGKEDSSEFRGSISPALLE